MDSESKGISASTMSKNVVKLLQATKAAVGRAATVAGTSMRHLAQAKPNSHSHPSCSRRQCDSASVLVRQIYSRIPQGGDASAGTAATAAAAAAAAAGSGLVFQKADKSALTIADCCVQHLLTEHLLSSAGLAGIVGEEDGTEVNLAKLPYSLRFKGEAEALLIPEVFSPFIDEAKERIAAIGKELGAAAASGPGKPGYGSLTAWIDPIDGTKEFSRGRGDHCTICVGFADVEMEHPFAGIVYRPISSAFARAVATRGVAAAALPSAAAVSEVDSNFAMGCELPRSLRYAAMRNDAMPCDAMPCDAMRCDAIRCDAPACAPLRFLAKWALRHDAVIIYLPARLRAHHFDSKPGASENFFEARLDVAWPNVATGAGMDAPSPGLVVSRSGHSAFLKALATELGLQVTTAGVSRRVGAGGGGGGGRGGGSISSGGDRQQDLLSNSQYYVFNPRRIAASPPTLPTTTTTNPPGRGEQGAPPPRGKGQRLHPGPERLTMGHLRGAGRARVQRGVPHQAPRL